MNPAEPLNKPQSLSDLFWSFNWLALQGFGGVLVVAQRELVDKKRWLTREQFVEDWAVAQTLPGPNVVNLSMMLGDRYFGLTGGLVALAGILLAPMLLVIGLAVLYSEFANIPQVSGAVRGMGAVSGGLIAATSAKMLLTLKTNPMRMPTCMAISCLTFVAVGLLRWRLAWVLLGFGLMSCLWCYRCMLAQQDKNRQALACANEAAKVTQSKDGGQS
jgi:chromate transporter